MSKPLASYSTKSVKSKDYIPRDGEPSVCDAFYKMSNGRLLKSLWLSYDYLSKRHDYATWHDEPHNMETGILYPPT